MIKITICEHANALAHEPVCLEEDKVEGVRHVKELLLRNLLMQPKVLGNWRQIVLLTTSGLVNVLSEYSNPFVGLTPILSLESELCFLVAIEYDHETILLVFVMVLDDPTLV